MKQGFNTWLSLPSLSLQIYLLFPASNYSLPVVFVSSLDNLADKKNENKEVAVNDFLPASAAHEAVSRSMNLYAEYIVESLRR